MSSTKSEREAEQARITRFGDTVGNAILAELTRQGSDLSEDLLHFQWFSSFLGDVLTTAERRFGENPEFMRAALAGLVASICIRLAHDAAE